jgi:signal transduction histidine kinase
MHQIGISTSSIQNYIKGTVFRLDNSIEITTDDLKKVFSKINYEINRIHSISKLATRANFKSTTQDVTLNVVDFTEQYLLNVVKPFLPSNIEVVLYRQNATDFEISFKPLEFTIVLDNLLSNSRRANASKIEVSFSRHENELVMIFRDNGKGIEEKNHTKIFDYGFTTTEGSGLGMSHISEIITKIGGSIRLNRSYKDGAEFIINLKQQ